MTSSIHAGWAPPRDRFEPTSMPYHQVPGSRQFIGNDVTLDGRKSATSALMSDALLKEEAMGSGPNHQGFWSPPRACVCIKGHVYDFFF